MDSYYWKRPRGITNDIPEVKRFWDKWNLRVVILYNILVQICLLFGAPQRKKTANKVFIMSIWAVYLIADWAASLALGLVSDSEEKYTSSGTMNETASLFVMMNNGTVSPIRDDTGPLLMMWPPFLLLLVGGQDRIISFAVEDNGSWLRNLIWLLLQVSATFFLINNSFHVNKLRWPSNFLLLAGSIKYLERIAALYLASSDSFGISVLGEPDPGPNYERLMSVYTHYKGNNLPTEIEIVNDLESQSLGGGNNSNPDAKLGSLDLVQYAHQFAYIYKGLMVDLMFSSREHTESRKFFSKRDAKDTLKILEIQLNYFYDLLHSKVVVATSKIGMTTRGMCTVLVVLAFSLFHIEEKRTFQPYDVGVTYTLFGAVLGLDMANLLIWFYSDWTVASLENFDKESRRFKIIKMLLFPKKKTREQPRGPGSVFSRRWSENLSQFNFLNYCYPSKSDDCCAEVYLRIVKYFISVIYTIYFCLPRVVQSFLEHKGSDLRIQLGFVSSYHFDPHLWEFIFNELKEKSDFADDQEEAKRISSARGEWILENSYFFDYSISSQLMPYVKIVAYDESLLLWHIATEICYNTDPHSNDQSSNREQIDAREVSKRLSDYMFFLLNQQQGMMSEVSGISKQRFNDTSSEARRFFSEYAGAGLQDGCRNILEVKTSVKPAQVKGDQSKSVLFDACMLAKEINKLRPEIKWKVTSKVWVELLSYAASRSKAKAHIQQLSKGGELITFVWLLMAQLGLKEHAWVETRTRAKLNLHK